MSKYEYQYAHTKIKSYLELRGRENMYFCSFAGIPKQCATCMLDVLTMVPFMEGSNYFLTESYYYYKSFYY